MKSLSKELGYDFRRWFDNQLAAKGLTIQDVALALGETPRKAGRLLNNTDDWTATHAKRVGDLLGIHWWDELLMPLGDCGLKTAIDFYEANRLLSLEGGRLDHVVNVA